jgi:predicted regulator of Ras-like GTPase activity (Roadblock/LC7/MglB family)
VTTGSPAGAPGRGHELRALLRDVVALPGVRGGLIVAADGLAIAAELPGGAVEALSALAATLGRELELRGPRVRRGAFLAAHFTGTEGSVFVVSSPIGFLVVVADGGANADAVRYALRGATELLRQVWSRGSGRQREERADGHHDQAGHEDGTPAR